MVIDENLSRRLWAMRAIAIFSVICAHCSLQVTDDENLLQYEAHVLSNFGTLGVGVFFFLSGFFFHPWKIHNFRKYIRNYIIPWVISATMVYLYVTLRKGTVNVANCALFILGYGTLYYFMTDLVIIQGIMSVLVRIIKKSSWIYVFCTAINLAALYADKQGLSFAPTVYLNPCIFISFFALGKWMRDSNIINDYRIKTKARRNAFICLLILLSAFFMFSGIELTYYMGPFEVVVETIFILMLLSMGISDKGVWTVVYIGKRSFAIYLWHIPIAGIVSNIFNRWIAMKYVFFLWPVVVLVLTLFVLQCVLYAMKKLGIERHRWLLGVK